MQAAGQAQNSSINSAISTAQKQTHKAGVWLRDPIKIDKTQYTVGSVQKQGLPFGLSSPGAFVTLIWVSPDG